MLEINGLVKKYKDFTLDCSMKVGRGCITGLVGENGAGKSTSFKAALGLISYDSGDIKLMGKAVRAERSRKRKDRSDSGGVGIQRLSESKGHRAGDGGHVSGI